MTIKSTSAAFILFIYLLGREKTQIGAESEPPEKQEDFFP